MKIVWSPEALADLEAAVDYLAQRNPRAAVKLAQGIVDLVEQLAEGSPEGPEHVLRDGQRVRGWPHPPFRLYYQRNGEEFLVLRVYHQRRAPITR